MAISLKIQQIKKNWNSLINNIVFSNGLCTTITQRIIHLNKLIPTECLDWGLELKKTLIKFPLENNKDKIRFTLHFYLPHFTNLDQDSLLDYFLNLSRYGFHSLKDYPEDDFYKLIATLDKGFDSFLKVYTIPVVGKEVLASQAMEGVLLDKSPFKKTNEQYGRAYQLGVFFKLDWN